MSALVPLFRRVQAGELEVIVSAITEAELLVRPERDGDSEAIERVRDLLSEKGIFVIDVNRRIARRASALRARTRLALADAIIVATAVETGCDGIVGNDAEWAKLEVGVPFVQLGEIVKQA